MDRKTRGNGREMTIEDPEKKEKRRKGAQGLIVRPLGSSYTIMRVIRDFHCWQELQPVNPKRRRALARRSPSHV